MDDIIGSLMAPRKEFHHKMIVPSNLTESAPVVLSRPTAYGDGSPMAIPFVRGVRHGKQCHIKRREHHSRLLALQGERQGYLLRRIMEIAGCSHGNLLASGLRLQGDQDRRALGGGAIRGLQVIEVTKKIDGALQRITLRFMTAPPRRRSGRCSKPGFYGRA